jgi:branched-chain amino acid transport system ATP-binding protein
MSILQVSHLSLTIGTQIILKNVCFTVEPGEVVGLIGPNGSGKTTLLNTLSGFHIPSHGSIHLYDADITNIDTPTRANLGIGRVFQNFGIFRDMTVAENVLVALEAMPKEAQLKLGNLQKHVRETLQLVHLQDHSQKKAGTLSGGQLRLLEIARTLASGKELFLLDEPTAGVSPKMTQQVAELILSLKQQGKTVFIIEHDLPFIARICDRVLVLDLGEIVMSGTPKEIRHNPKIKELYFGADPTN